jgi:TetR/AcrR family transcriptional regulator
MVGGMVRTSVLRGQLLEASLRLFVAHGFRGTSLQDIASEVGCSKASLGYHFANKEAILLELVTPLIEAMDKLNTRLDSVPDDQVAALAVEGFVDVALEFRGQIMLLLAESQEVVGKESQDRDEGERLVNALASRSPRPQDRVRAWMAMGGIVIATAGGPQLSREQMRDVLISSALQSLTDSPRG